MRFRRLTIYFLTGCLAMKGVNHLSFSLRTHNTYIVQKTWIRACKRLLVTEHSWKSRVYEFSSKHMCTLLYFIRLHSSIAKQSVPLNENRIFSWNSEPFLLWATPFIYFRQLVISCLKSSRRDCLGRAQIFHGAPFLRLWEFPMIGCFDVFCGRTKQIKRLNLKHCLPISMKFQKTQPTCKIPSNSLKYGGTGWEYFSPLPRPDKEEAGRTRCWKIFLRPALAAWYIMGPLGSLKSHFQVTPTILALIKQKKEENFDW